MAELRILPVAHDHPAWTPGGTEILARAMDARPDASARLLVAATSLQRPGAAPGSLQALGEDTVLCTGAYDRFTTLRCDGEVWVAGLGRALEAVRPDVVHFHGLDRIDAEAAAAVRRLAPGARIVMTLHDYQLICPNDGLLLTTTDGAPLVILEAQAAGRPVICSGIGGMAELVADGMTGLHVAPGDAAALAGTMMAAAEDPALWARLAGAARVRDHGAFVEAHLSLHRGLSERVAA